MFLPESLIALLLLQITPLAAEPHWPHNVPQHLKYFPEHEVHVKRSLSIQERLENGERPIGVKKMSEDEGEMFFLDNWIFAGDEDDSKQSPVFANATTSQSANASIPILPPLRRHAGNDVFSSFGRVSPRSSVFARDFKCPADTNDCSSIGAPNSCCSTGSICIKIEDTGFGSVGCCANGQTCAGAISCNEQNGYSSCPDSPNGGCCIPGYTCQDEGCIFVGTSVTYVQPSTSAVRSSSTAVVVVPTDPPSSSSTPQSSDRPSSSYTCTSGWFSCPASLGGGCCQNGRQCATGASCLGTDSTSATSSQAPSAPVRPTGPSNSAITSQSSSATPTDAPLCPTGFYVCSAYYPNGCCRVGRDCQTTGSCAPTSSETIVNSNGVTVVAPTGASLASGNGNQGGACATGWYSCAASLGGDCCPDGYACGDQCTATSGGETSEKAAPSTATTFSYTTICMSFCGAAAIGIAMILL